MAAAWPLKAKEVCVSVEAPDPQGQSQPQVQRPLPTAWSQWGREGGLRSPDGIPWRLQAKCLRSQEVGEKGPAQPSHPREVQDRLQVTQHGAGWSSLGSDPAYRRHCHPSPCPEPTSHPHLLALSVWGEGVSRSGTHGGAEGAAGALVARVALSGPGLGGAQQLGVKLAVGRGWCGRDDQRLQGCHLCLQHVDLHGMGWLSTLTQTGCHPGCHRLSA